MTTTESIKLTINAIAFVGSMAVVSLAAPAFYCVLILVAFLIGLAALSYTVTTTLLESDCPIDNVLGIQAVLSLVGLLFSMSE